MPQFAYKAKKDDGSLVQGTVQAESERSALDSLGRMGVYPVAIESRDRRVGEAKAPRRSMRRAGADDVAIFTRQLSDLLRAGVPLDRSLKTLSDQTTNGELAGAIEEVRRDVSGGKTLQEAMVTCRQFVQAQQAVTLENGQPLDAFRYLTVGKAEASAMH